MPLGLEMLSAAGLSCYITGRWLLLDQRPALILLSFGQGNQAGMAFIPLLFAIAIEPLAVAIRNSQDITGISVGEKDHKIALYADDILLFITNPTKSIPAVFKIMNQFSKFSGYKIHFSKSEVMPLGNSSRLISCPFKWSPTGFTYLGTSITPSLEAMYKANFEPLLKHVCDDLDRWTSLPLSMMGRIALLKMNILPRLLYHFQMVPILYNNKIIRRVKGWISSFIWNRKKLRLKMAKLQMSVEQGGLAVPNIAPIYGNIDFASDMGFKMWEERGILTLRHIFDKGVMLTFEQIRQKYGLPSNFFRYLQICSFIQNQSRHDFDCRKMERLLLDRGKKAVLGQRYADLNSASNMNLVYL